VRYIRWGKLWFWLKQLVPCTYWTTYGDKDGAHFVIWRMWFGHCFKIEDVLIPPHVLVEQDIRRICNEEIENILLRRYGILDSPRFERLLAESDIDKPITHRPADGGGEVLAAEIKRLYAEEAASYGRDKKPAPISVPLRIPSVDPETKLTEHFKETMKSIDGVDSDNNTMADNLGYASVAIAPTSAVSPLSTTASEEIFREHIRHLLSQDIFPTPTRLNNAMHSNVKYPNNISGKQSRWRSEELTAAGYRKINGRWRKS